MAKTKLKYDRLNSGLLVPRREVQPWWAGKLTPMSARFFSQRRAAACCCDESSSNGSGSSSSSRSTVLCYECSGTNHDAPQQFQVEISGVTDDDVRCTNCSIYDGTWILKAGTSACQWRSDPKSGYACQDNLTNPWVSLTIRYGIITVSLGGSSSSWREGETFSKTYSGSIDCMNLASESLTDKTSLHCNISVATCEVTAL